ncbi:MAG: family 78 glycoside hydrolase catalytic domain [Theionarchaea archaeon]|nr:family 78 glycoside hydrolase catalytic domain [Theionarchaea archaeon]
MALLKPEDWQAKWIGRGPGSEPRGRHGFFNAQPEESGEGEGVEVDERSTLIRKEITLDKSVRRARIYVCGLGMYELSINGRRIGEKVLNPPKTHYRRQVLYDTYDTTNHLAIGRNAIGVHLGNGWFNPLKKYWTWRMQWFGSKRMILQMHIEYENGSVQVITSDESWRSAPGPVITSCIYDGESYDANEELPGWDEPNYDDSAWEPVNVVEAPGGEMISQMMEPIKLIDVIKPVGLSNPEDGVYVYDMGQNFSGWARLRVEGQGGTRVELRYAENVHEDGTLDPESMNLARARGSYIMRGGGEEVYEPRFTYYGFRYVEVKGYPGEPRLKDLEGCVVHSACEQTGYFECSNELINAIHKCTIWSQRSNLMGFPTDCPQRDERLGWLGDAHVTAEEAMLNFHMPLFYRNWLGGIQANRDGSGDVPYISPRPHMEVGKPDWSSGYLLIVWYYYLHYGDRQILQEHFDEMRGYVDYLGTTAEDYILPKSRYGDWLSVADGWVRGDPESTTTAFYYFNTKVLIQAARVLGREGIARKYTELLERIRESYNRHFFDSKSGIYDNGSQFSNAFPLLLGIVQDEHRQAVLQNLIHDIVDKQNGHLTTGILGTKYMIEALSEAGRDDIAYLIVNSQGYPGWADMIEGRTTLSERWNKTGSNNHVMFGSIDTWFYRALAGIDIDPEQPGYSNVIIKPTVLPGLSWAGASIETILGRVSTDWGYRDGEYRLSITIPANATATIYVLARGAEGVTESGEPASSSPGVRFISREGGYVIYEIGSGTYEFKSLDK